ncbi:twin-arginine translocation signal domain-containing protein, partial [Burkholderia contaminans]
MVSRRQFLSGSGAGCAAGVD